MADDEFVPDYGQESNYGLGDGIGVIAGPDYVAPVAGPTTTNYVPPDVGYTPVTIPAYDVPAYDVGTYDIGLPTPPVEQGWVANTMDFVSGAFGGVYNFLNPAPEMYTDHAASMGYPVLGEDVLATMDPGKLALYHDNQRQLKSKFSSDQNKATWNPGTWGFDQWQAVIGAGIGLYQYNENQELQEENRKANSPEGQAQARIDYVNELEAGGFDQYGNPLTSGAGGGGGSSSSGGGGIVTSNHSQSPFLT